MDSQKKFKIAHFTNYWPELHNIWGGAERACQRTVEVLNEAGIENHVFTLSASKKSPNNIHFIPVVENFLPKDLGSFYAHFKLFVFPFDMLSFLSSFRWLQKTKPQIVHLHNFNYLSFSVLAAARILKIPAILSIYDYWYFCPQEMLMKKDGSICKDFQGKNCKNCYEFGRFNLLKRLLLPLRKPIFDFFLKKIDRFIALSGSSKMILEKYGLKPEKIEIIRQPISLKIKNTDKTGILPGQLLFVGWKEKRKGLHILLPALKMVLQKYPSAKLIAVGKDMDHGYVEEIKKYIVENNLSRNVELLQRISQDELDRFWLASDIVLIPEQWENMSPLLLLEAMAWGKAVIASRIGGIPEFIDEEENGLLAEYNSPDDFARKILSLLGKPSMAEDLGRKAQEKISFLSNEKEFLSKQLSLYKKVMRDAK